MPITPQYLNNLNVHDDYSHILWLPVAANTTISQGDLLQVSSGYVSPAVAASTTIAGLADADFASKASVDPTKDRIPVVLARGAVIRMNYSGTTKTTLAQADLYGTAFDLSSQTTINLDDTTGGMCKVLAYDNTAKTADVYIAPTAIAI